MCQIYTFRFGISVDNIPGARYVFAYRGGITCLIEINYPIDYEPTQTIYNRTCYGRLPFS